MGHERFSGIWSSTGNKILSKQILKIRKQAKGMNCQSKFSVSLKHIPFYSSLPNEEKATGNGKWFETGMLEN